MLQLIRQPQKKGKRKRGWPSFPLKIIYNININPNLNCEFIKKYKYKQFSYLKEILNYNKEEMQL